VGRFFNWGGAGDGAAGEGDDGGGVVAGALVDPAGDQFDLGGGEGVAFGGHLGLGAGNLGHQSTVFGITDFDRRPVFAAGHGGFVSRQVQSALELARLVAADAARREDGHDLFFEADRRLVRGACLDGDNDPTHQRQPINGDNPHGDAIPLLPKRLDGDASRSCGLRLQHQPAPGVRFGFGQVYYPGGRLLLNRLLHGIRG
jgi:hypothetical protein